MITADRLREVSHWLTARKGGGDLQSGMRQAFPELHFTFCSDDDVALDAPASACEGYNLYLVDGSGHCLTLTTELTAASGLVIAEIEDDD